MGLLGELLLEGLSCAQLQSSVRSQDIGLTGTL